MSSLWLSKKTKPELIELCLELGLEDVSERQLKSELVSLLSDHLEENEITLATNPSVSAYYDTVAVRSPTKSTMNSSTIAVVEDAPATRTRRRTSRYVPGTATFENNSTEESTPEPTERKVRASSRALATRTPRTVRNLRSAAQVPLPPSPAAVADHIESRTNALLSSAKKAVQKAEIPEKAVNVRDVMSNAVAVNAAALTYEALLLIRTLIPFAKELTIPAMETTGTPQRTYWLPDLFVILTTAFWGPFLTWLTTALLLPLGNSMIINMVSTAAIAKPGPEYRADPMTFAVTKALLAYLIHYHGFQLWGILGKNAVETVGASVGTETQLICAGIGAIAALWEGVLGR